MRANEDLIKGRNAANEKRVIRGRMALTKGSGTACWAIFLLVSSCSCSCPTSPSADFTEVGGEFVWTSSDTKSFYEATDVCQSKNAKLIEPRTADLMTYLNSEFSIGNPHFETHYCRLQRSDLGGLDQGLLSAVLHCRTMLLENPLALGPRLRG